MRPFGDQRGAPLGLSRFVNWMGLEPSLRRAAIAGRRDRGARRLAVFILRRVGEENVDLRAALVERLVIGFDLPAHALGELARCSFESCGRCCHRLG